MMTFWGGCRGSWIYPWRMAQGYLRENGLQKTDGALQTRNSAVRWPSSACHLVDYIERFCGSGPFRVFGGESGEIGNDINAM